jgi:hypothetical protein
MKQTPAVHVSFALCKIDLHWRKICIERMHESEIPPIVWFYLGCCGVIKISINIVRGYSIIDIFIPFFRYFDIPKILKQINIGF